MRRRLAVVSAVVGSLASASVVYYLVGCVRAELSSNSETSFQSLVAAGISLVVAVIAWTVFAALGSARLPPARVHEDESETGSDTGGILASVSVVAGVLAWLPLLPLVSPVGYAAIAMVAGLFALRALQSRGARRDLRIAVAGTVAGTLYVLVLWLARMRGL